MTDSSSTSSTDRASILPPEISSFTTRRPVAITMVFVAAVVFGYFSYGRLPVNLMPELSYVDKKKGGSDQVATSLVLNPRTGRSV